MTQNEYGRRDKAAGIWARDPYDWYVEPEWASAALFSREPFEGAVLDPACGLGRIVIEARRAGHEAAGCDIVDRSVACTVVADFFADDWLGRDTGAGISNIVCNPPFGRSDDFVRLALMRTKHKVALLLPATWHFGSKRAKWLEETPLRRVFALTPRPSMPPGAVILAGEKPGGGTKDFAWYVWEHGYVGPWQGGWLHRDALRLKRDSDYPVSLGPVRAAAVGE